MYRNCLKWIIKYINNYILLNNLIVVFLQLIDYIDLIIIGVLPFNHHQKTNLEWVIGTMN